jgi:acetyl esterase/lipase
MNDTGKSLPAIPADLWALMATVGPRWGENVPMHVQLMIDRFSEVLRAGPEHCLPVRYDITYGAHERQMLDVYLPAPRASAKPAVVFVHGGAFLDGNRNRSDQIYSNVLKYFACNGLVGVNVGYRLGRDAPYPGGSLDVAAAVQWVQRNADDLGIDREQIFLMGHSAGSAHVGTYAYDRQMQPPGGHGLRGVIIVSGRVRAETCPDNPNAAKVALYYGTPDMDKLDALSPVSHVGVHSPPTFVAWSEFENPLIDVHCVELVFRLGQAKRRTPPTFWLRGHNHMSAIAHFNTAEDALGQAILRFITNPY